MELAQLDNKLLRKLQDEAPGTFQHSLLVGTLVERAADRIAADSLLARVGAYYHDIGKLVSPSFFAENLNKKSPHDSLDPLQSTRVIHQHVTAGIEMAKKEGLPDDIVQFVQQHHGTRLASFFYRIAAEKTPDIDTELFRYPGPKPQSKEVALVMLADSSEAAVRASSDHSSENITKIVDAVIKERFDEDQLDECDLSIKEIKIAADSISTALIAVFHPRVDYPKPSKQELIDRGIYSVGVDENIINVNNEDGTQLSLGTNDKSDKIS
jgi:putative nucleotidyltransferase with HDIG domain